MADHPSSPPPAVEDDRSDHSANEDEATSAHLDVDDVPLERSHTEAETDEEESSEAEEKDKRVRNASHVFQEAIDVQFTPDAEKRTEEMLALEEEAQKRKMDEQQKDQKDQKDQDDDTLSDGDGDGDAIASPHATSAAANNEEKENSESKGDDDNADDFKSPYSDREIMARRGAIREAFGIFDSDGGGTIETEEITSILNLVGLSTTPEDIARISERMGMKDDAITLEDFIKSFEPLIIGKSKEDENDDLSQIFETINDGEVRKLRDAFQACDQDGSNEIDLDELKVVMISLGENLSDEEILEMYNQLDEDGDGGISFDEFIKFMCKRNCKSSLKGRTKSMAKFFSVENLNSISSFLQDRDISPEESAAVYAEMPLLERMGADFMKDEYRKKTLVTKEKVKVKDNVHVLSKDERRSLQKIERITIGLDMLLGAISAILCGFAELFASDEWETDGVEDKCSGNETCTPSLDERITYFWLVVGGISVVVSIIEILFIYWIHLKSAIAVSQITGLKLFPIDKERALITSALARAALELPHPQKEEYGVNPLAEASKWKLFIAGLLYKAKTGLTTFILRLLVKRVLARVAVKSILAFVAIPVNMFFNGMIGYKCIRGARVIAIGPSVAVEVFSGLAKNFGKFSMEMKIATMRTIAVVITSVEMMHPNLRILLQHSQETLNFYLLHPLPVEDMEGPLTSEQAKKAVEARKADPDRFMKDQVDGNEDDVEEDDISKAKMNDTMIKSSSAVEHSQLTKSQGSVDSMEIEMDVMDSPPKALFRQSSSLSSIGEGEDQIDERAEGGGHDALLVRPGNVPRFLHCIANASEKEQVFLCKLLAFSMVLNGFVGKGLVKLFQRATGIACLPTDDFPLHWLTLQFIRGEINIPDVDLFFDSDHRSQMNMSGCKNRTHFCCDRTAVCLSC